MPETSKNVPPAFLSMEDLKVWQFLSSLSKDYPDFTRWFWSKVVPGLEDGSRYVLKIERQGVIAGVGIAKKTPEECKICTVRVAPEYAGKGIGIRIFGDLMEWLDTDRPHLTVGSDKIPAFDRIFSYFGYNFTSRHDGLYVPDKAELFFNENSPASQD